MLPRHQLSSASLSPPESPRNMAIETNQNEIDVDKEAKHKNNDN